MDLGTDQYIVLHWTTPSNLLTYMYDSNGTERKKRNDLFSIDWAMTG